MITNDLLARINELARKSKEEGLTAAEKKEQERLRNDYLKGFRSSFTNQIKTIKIVDEEGNDVTPEKLKELKNNTQDERE